MKIQTQILRAIEPDPLTGAISTPIYQTSTFVQEAPGIHKGYDYARSNNPTRKVLEDLIAKLESGHQGFAFASGLAAIDAVVKLLSSGDEIIAVNDIYGGAYRLFTHIYQKFGIKVHYCDTSNPENILPLLSPKTKLIWLESPTNPTLRVSPIEAIAHIACEQKLLLCVDNTFASPASQKPIEFGADIVIHSGTKYLAGHSDVIAGLVVTQNEELSQQIKFNQNSSGGILGPWDSWLTIRGIETLGLRVKEHSRNATIVAQFLSKHPLIKNVYYPFLESDPGFNIAKSQQKFGGGVVSFDLVLDEKSLAAKLVTSTHLFHLAESLGGVKSLICQPCAMTHASIPAEKRQAAGVSDSLIRLSVGLEDPQDLVADLDKALNALTRFPIFTA